MICLLLKMTFKIELMNHKPQKPYFLHQLQREQRVAIWND